MRRVSKIFDVVLFAAFSALIQLVRILPPALSVSVVSCLFRMVLLFVPRFRSAGQRNLALAFPDQPSLREQILKKSYTEIARAFVDCLRVQFLDTEWFRKHVKFVEYKASTDAIPPDVGTLFATGHLGSFELLGHALAIERGPLWVIMRKFKSPRLNAWWVRMRELRGSRCMDRKGALRAMIKALRAGENVALLFDQNVTRNSAIFVDWFGRKAATTPAIALASLMTGCPIEVLSIKNNKDGTYEASSEPCPIDDLRFNDSMTRDEKVFHITQRLTAKYTERISAFSEGWFWIHRRWKTAPTDAEETFYR